MSGKKKKEKIRYKNIERVIHDTEGVPVLYRLHIGVR